MNHLSALAAEIDLVNRVLDDTDPAALTAAVPACPGWTVRDAVAHLGGVHRMVIHAVREGTRPDRDGYLPGDDVDPAAWFRAGGEELLRVLDVDPATPAWTHLRENRHVGYWHRRQVLENAVHRVDIEQGLGLPARVDPDVAADGVGEVVDVMVPMMGRGGLRLEEAVRLTGTDVGRTWTLGDGDLVGSAAGTAEELFLVLWKRLPLATLDLSGDAARLLGLRLTP